MRRWGRLARENIGSTLLVLFVILPMLGAALVYSVKYFILPKTVVVGALEVSPEAKILGELSRILPDTSFRIRTRVQTFASPDALSKAIADKSLDMAVLRSDRNFPANARSVLKFREVSVSFLALAETKLVDIGALKQKQVGVLSLIPDTDSIVRETITLGGAAGAKLLEMNDASTALQALKDQTVLAIAITDTPERKYLRQLLRRDAASEMKLDFVPFMAATELATVNPGIMGDKIAAKSLTVRPPYPAEETPIVKVDYRLVARADLDRSYVARIAEALFSQRARIAANAPEVNTIMTVDSDYVTASLFPVHEGALDYFRREQMSFYTRYSDLIWLGIFYGGSFFSLFAWLGERMFARRRRERDILLELARLLKKIQTASSSEHSRELAGQADRIVASVLVGSSRGKFSSRRLTAILLGYQAIQNAAALADLKAQISNGDQPRSLVALRASG